eukprot:284818688_4
MYLIRYLHHFPSHFHRLNPASEADKHLLKIDKLMCLHVDTQQDILTWEIIFMHIHFEDFSVISTTCSQNMPAFSCVFPRNACQCTYTCILRCCKVLAHQNRANQANCTTAIHFHLSTFHFQLNGSSWTSHVDCPSEARRYFSKRLEICSLLSPFIRQSPLITACSPFRRFCGVSASRVGHAAAKWPTWLQRKQADRLFPWVRAVSVPLSPIGVSGFSGRCCFPDLRLAAAHTAFQYSSTGLSKPTPADAASGANRRITLTILA